MKESVVIIAAYQFCKLRTECYSAFCCLG